MRAGRGALLLSCLAWAGCGTGAATSDAGHDAEPEDAGRLLTPEAYFLERDRTDCRHAVMCESRARTMGRVDPNAAMTHELPCHPAFERSSSFGAITRRAYREALETGLTRFDPSAAEACLTGLQALDSCPPWRTVSDPEACDHVFVVDAPSTEGGACLVFGRDPVTSFGLWCAAGTRCVADATCAGTCQPLGVDGEPCRSHSECDIEDHWCDPVTWRCGRLPGLGEPCDLACVLDTYCNGGMCVPQVPLGEPCDVELWSVCEGWHECLEGDDGIARCTDLGTVGEGGPCIPYFEDTCPPALACFRRDEVTLVGACLPPRTLGEPCSALEPCGRFARCDGGTCKQITLPGETCGADVLCPLTHLCAGDGVCTPLPVLGEACLGRCLEGMCLDGICQLAPVGAECDGRNLAPLGACVGYCSGSTLGYCRESLPEGASCGGDAPCQTGLVCDRSGSGACIPWMCDR